MVTWLPSRHASSSGTEKRTQTVTIFRVFLLVTLVGLPVMAHSTAPRQDSELEPLIDELRALVATAERQNLADPSLIARLRAFMAKHDFPWKHSVFSDDFRDGNYTVNPAWEVLEGSYRIDSRYGLVARPTLANTRSRRSNSNDLAAQIFSQLLQQRKRSDSGSTNAPQTVARIQVEQRIANAFAVDTRVSAIGQGGELVVSVAQSKTLPETAAYRLTIQNTVAEGVVLTRRTPRGDLVLGSHGQALQPNQRGYHDFQWQRDKSGHMTIAHNGTTLFSVRDNGIRNAFAHLILESQGAETGVRSVRVSGATP